MRPSRLTQSSRSSRMFQTRPSLPPGTNAGNLRDGEVRVDPVPRLRHEHRVDTAVRQRDRLGGAIERGHPRQRARQLPRIPATAQRRPRRPAHTAALSFPVPAPRSRTRTPTAATVHGLWPVRAGPARLQRRPHRTRQPVARGDHPRWRAGAAAALARAAASRCRRGWVCVGDAACPVGGAPGTPSPWRGCHTTACCTRPAAVLRAVVEGPLAGVGAAYLEAAE